MKISVIIPIYNIEKHLKKCLNSIIRANNFNELEIILVDDGATDTSGKIADKYAKNYKNIKVIHQKNQGLSAARNAGIRQSSGDYISLIDGDDFVLPNFFEVLKTEAELNSADIVQVGYKKHGGGNEEIVPPKYTVLSGIAATRQLLIEQNTLDAVAWNKLYRKSLFSEHGVEYPRNELNEDMLTTYKLFFLAKKIVFVPKALYCYAIHNEGIMGRRNVFNVANAKLKMAQEAIKFLPTEHKNIAYASRIIALFACLNSLILSKSSNSKAWHKIKKIINEDINKIPNARAILPRRIFMYRVFLNLGLYRAVKTCMLKFKKSER